METVLVLPGLLGDEQGKLSCPSLAYKMSTSNLGFGILPRSLISSLKNPDYSPWQRKTATKKQTFRVALPPVSLSERKKERKKTPPRKSKDRSVRGKSPVFGLKTPQSMRQTPHSPQATTKEIILAEGLDNIKIMQKNQELVEKIKEMDADTAKQARDLLQQYDMFGTIITTLENSSENQVGIAKRKLLETEKMVEKNMGKLDMEMARMNAKVQALQEEVNVLRSYMDKEYPVKAKKLSQYQDGLEQMDRNNLELKRQIAGQKEIIGELVKEIKELHRSIIKLHHSVRDPRDVIFADVLLHRPKCTPDMDVVLNIPTDEDFPL
ncbi:hypothetical protein JD844_019274 [Phrynosoma platyrhinos]|uniref:Uncharacterized protein n=1 Tax=Phrynosoma platyrhinos TaxID=52577 RepID=A0ABQ7SPL4_PHRPL|nr:hypothetical protein JD844_019274 [Phrynosoma platyrhinos]